jgi:DNA polymerase
MLGAMGVRLFEAPHGNAPEPDPVRPEVSKGVSEPVEGLRQAESGPSFDTSGRSEQLPQGERVAQDESRSDIATLDWSALRDAVSQCRACALCESRTQTVFGVGHERARLMIVGEAPGENEDLQGEPFVGQSGKLLDNMLKAIGLARNAATPEQGVFICNTVKCRPPRNRNPDAAEIARCAPYLERQIALVRPKLILAMGRFAVQALLGTDEAIGKLRGRVHARRGVPVIVTYHPAYLLRTLADKARAWDDLCLAASVLELPA